MWVVADFRLLVVALALCFSAPSLAQDKNSTNDETLLISPAIRITSEKLLSELSLDQKIGQLLFFGFFGTKYSSEVKASFQKIRPGGIVVFRKNIKSAEQISQLNYDAQVDFLDNNSVPLFIAIDQEGGLVTRIKSRPPLPSALALGETNSREVVGRMGFYTGTLMRALGFNMNLAPVLDIANPHTQTFIGTRSFSGNSDAVSKMAYAFAQGLQMAGIVSTLKHYPGHGGPAADSHKQVPIMRDDIDSLLKSHLKPFLYLTTHLDAPAIMVAHVLYPKIDREPATYSKVLVSDVLRKRLRFDGLVITDDIDMAGAKKIKDSGEQAVRALEAGVDMIMVAWHRSSQDKAFRAIKRAVQTGRLSMQRIDQSVRRILDTKIKYGLFAPPQTPSIKTINTVFNDPNFRKSVETVLNVNIERSLKSIPLARPLSAGKKVNIFAQSPSFARSFTTGSSPDCCRYFPLKRSTLIKTLRRNDGQVNLLYISGARSLSLANSIPAVYASRVIVVNTGIPGVIKSPSRFMGVINLYSPDVGAGELIARALYSAPPANLRNPASDAEEDPPGPENTAEDKSERRRSSALLEGARTSGRHSKPN